MDRRIGLIGVTVALAAAAGACDLVQGVGGDAVAASSAPKVLEPDHPCDKAGVYGCTADKKKMLECAAGHWKTVELCLGQNGCVANAKGAKCDQSISEEGAVCRNENTYSCTADKKMMLRCDGERLKPAGLCKGMHGCRKQFDQIQCNQQIAAVGDVCDEAYVRYACSEDGKARLTCTAGKFVKDKSCGRCQVIADKIRCA